MVNLSKVLMATTWSKIIRNIEAAGTEFKYYDLTALKDKRYGKQSKFQPISCDFSR